MNVCCDVTLLPLSPDWMDKGELERYDLILKVSTACLQVKYCSKLTNLFATFKISYTSCNCISNEVPIVSQCLV